MPMPNSYARLGIALAISLVIMFLAHDVHGRRVGHGRDHGGADGRVMLLVMWGMFPNRRLNVALLAGFALLFVGALWLGRTEAFIGDAGFLRSMIPHHSRAILVCQEADITDPEIIQLCDQIIRAQRSEIEQMQRIMADRY